MSSLTSSLMVVRPTRLSSSSMGSFSGSLGFSGSGAGAGPPVAVCTGIPLSLSVWPAVCGMPVGVTSPIAPMFSISWSIFFLLDSERPWESSSVRATRSCASFSAFLASPRGSGCFLYAWSRRSAALGSEDFLAEDDFPTGFLLPELVVEVPNISPYRPFSKFLSVLVRFSSLSRSLLVLLSIVLRSFRHVTSVCHPSMRPISSVSAANRNFSLLSRSRNPSCTMRSSMTRSGS